MSISDGGSELIERARNGDRAAIQRLLWSNYDRLAGIIRPKLAGNLNRHVTIEDVMQEAFIHAIRDIGSCQARSDESFAAWLTAIALHRLQDILKGLYRQKRRGEGRRARAPVGDSASALCELVELVSDHRSTPRRVIARHEAVQAIQVGIAALPTDQRNAIRLRYLQGKSIDETAAALGCTAAAVNGLVRRAKEALRGALADSSQWLSGK